MQRTLPKFVFAILCLLPLVGSLSLADDIDSINPITPVNTGFWGMWTANPDGCPNGEICAEWFQEGDFKHGTLCCIHQTDLGSTSFSSCLRYPSSTGSTEDPREDDHLI